MTTDDTPTTPLRRFFTGAGLPVFLSTAVIVYEAFLAALVFAPDGDGAWRAFAREFRVWCFSYDPRTGGMEWSAVGMMMFEPLSVVLVAALLWRRALATLRSRARLFAQWQAALGGVVASVLAAATLLVAGRPTEAAGLPPFPGERIRTQLSPPRFAFTDQRGQPCQLEDLRGRVVLVTGVYAQCSTSCPQILVETRQLLESLPPAVRANVSVVALCLNPEYETSEMMVALAAGYGFRYPEFRYLNGPAAAMHGVLEEFQFAPVRRADTGLIDHANLFLVIDAAGRIAYRFNLNPRHRAWLREALISLSAEAAMLSPERSVAQR